MILSENEHYYSSIHVVNGNTTILDIVYNVDYEGSRSLKWIGLTGIISTIFVPKNQILSRTSCGAFGGAVPPLRWEARYSLFSVCLSSVDPQSDLLSSFASLHWSDAIPMFHEEVSEIAEQDIIVSKEKSDRRGSDSIRDDIVNPLVPQDLISDERVRWDKKIITTMLSSSKRSMFCETERASRLMYIGIQKQLG